MKRANHLIRKSGSRRPRRPWLLCGNNRQTFRPRFRRQSWLSQLRPREQFGQHPPRLEKRLAAVQNVQHDETTEEQFPDGVRLVDNVEANRLQIFFPEIPPEGIRRELKRNGFHWSPTAGAWQWHRSNRATYLAKLILTNHTL